MSRRRQSASTKVEIAVYGHHSPADGLQGDEERHAVGATAYTDHELTGDAGKLATDDIFKLSGGHLT